MSVPVPACRLLCAGSAPPQGPTGRVLQPFGLPKPKFTGITPTYGFEGAGLYPNSEPTVTAWWPQYGTGTDTAVNAHADTGQSQSDGTFVIIIDPQALENVQYQRGTLFVKVTDASGSSVTGSAETPEPPPAVGALHVVTISSTPRPSPQHDCT